MSVFKDSEQLILCILFYDKLMNPGKNPSQNELSGENPSGEDPSKVSCGENP